MALDVVRAGIPSYDDCPALTRANAFLVPQGVLSTVEHVFRDRAGRPVDLSDYLDPAASESDSESSSGSASHSVVLMVSEPLTTSDTTMWRIAGEAADAANGVLRATLPAAAVEHAGIYLLSWGILAANDLPIAVNSGILSVERSQFASDARVNLQAKGPPTFNEIRMALLDSSAAENYWLDDVEFHDDQIAYAVVRPIRQWNESPPPMRRHRYSTRNFPFREAWLKAILGHLFTTAAHNYRRNHVNHSAGGVALNDKDKERNYLAIGQQLLREWDVFVATKRTQLNIAQVSGYVGSDYGRY